MLFRSISEQSEGAYIMGATINVKETFTVKIKDKAAFDWTTDQTIDTSSDRYTWGGWYSYRIDLSGVSADYNPYKDNKGKVIEANLPRIDFRLMPLLIEEYDQSFTKDGRYHACVTVQDKQGRTIRKVVDGVGKAFKERDISLDVFPELHEGPPAILEKVEPGKDHIFFVFKFPSGASGRYIFSVYDRFNPDLLTTRQFIYGERWDDLYKSFADYEHMLFIDTNMEMSIEVVSGNGQHRGANQYIDPFVVKVTGMYGEPLSGVELNFITTEPSESSPYTRWYDFEANAANPNGASKSITYSTTTDSDGLARAALYVGDRPNLKGDFKVKVSAQDTGDMVSTTIDFYCEEFTVDTNLDGMPDARVEDVTYAARRLTGIPVPTGYQELDENFQSWDQRKDRIFDMMLRYDNSNDRFNVCWPDWPGVYNGTSENTGNNPNLYMVCIEVPRAAYEYANFNVATSMQNDISHWQYHVNGPYTDDLFLSRTWNWSEFFYYH